MSPLLSVLAAERGLQELNPSEWDVVLREARQSRLLAYLYHRAAEQGCFDALPQAVQEVLTGSRVYTDHMHLAAQNELRNVAPLLAEAGCPVILLKGIAYQAKGFPWSAGRRLSDIDLLVPKAEIASIEAKLLAADWCYDEELSEYDLRYYREWTHELPPMRHPDGFMELDLHHNLIQPTGRITLDAALLFRAAQALPDSPFAVLSPPDMVLHSATHLFMSDELRGGLRDMVDIRDMLLHFGAGEADFWQRLVERARQLDTTRPLYYAVSTARNLLGLQVPDAVWHEIKQMGPSAPVARLMRVLITEHLTPMGTADPSKSGHAQGLSRWLLFVRSHWVRMPPLLLARHLAYKAWIRRGSAPA